jgi:hypothetical protein
MFLDRLKQLVARFAGRVPPPSAAPSEGPFAGVRQPRTRRPGGRNSAVAVMEPEPDQWVNAIGRSARRER